MSTKGFTFRSLLGRGAPETAPPPRPDGPLLWVHPGGRPDAVRLLIDELRSHNGALSILWTGPDAPSGVLTADPPETARAAARALDHWRPDALLWTGPAAAPALWNEAILRDIPLVAAEADPSRHSLSQVRPLEAFTLVTAVRRDPRLKAPIEVVGPLSTVPPPPAARPDDFAAMAELLAARSVWVALDVPGDEVATVLAAHAQASHLAHRLLLVLSPRPGVVVEAGDFKTASRGEGTEPEADVQVYVADEEGETGLWVRLATATYLGGGLAGPGPATCPGVPAALGSVVLHGPHSGEYGETLDRLARAGAAHAVRDADTLGRAVESFLSADRAAAAAHAAWSVVSEGALASALVLDAVEAALKGRRT